MTMNRIDQDELYGHIREFLKGKGVELQDGSYTTRIQQACHILARTINGSREALERAKAEADRRLNKVREVIHEKTAPPTPPPQPASPKANTASARPTASSPAKSRAQKSPPRAARGTKRRR